MVIDFMFFIFYALPFCFLALAIHLSNGSLLRINPLTFFLVFYFVRNHVGLLALFFEGFQYKDYDYSNVITLTYMAMINTLVFLVFFFFSKLHLYTRWAAHIGSLQVPQLKVRKTGYLILIGLIVGIYALALERILSGSAMLMLIESNADGSAEALKVRMTGYSEGSLVFGLRLQYLSTIFFAAEIVMLTFLVTGLKFKIKEHLFISFALFLGLLLWNTANASKGYIVVLAIYFYVAVCFIGDGKLRFYSKPVVLTVAGAVVVSSMFAYFVMGHSTLNIFYPLERFVIGNLRPQYVLMDTFGIHSVLLGQSAPSWFSLNNHTQFLLGEYSWRVMNGLTNPSVFYHNPSSFVAELHANFSGFAVLFIPIVYLYVLLFSWFLIRSAGSYGFFIAVYTTYYFSKYSVREIIPGIFDYRLVVTVLLALIVLKLVTRRA